MSRPLEELREDVLVSEGILVQGDGRKQPRWNPETQQTEEAPVAYTLADGKTIAVGDDRGGLIAARIFGTHEGIVYDYALQPGTWEAR